jgi:hypothetical protein
MIVAAIATLITLFSAHIFQFYSRIDVLALLGLAVAGTCSIASLVTARRSLDLVSLVAGASLAGFLAPFWAEGTPSSTMAMLAWFLLVASCIGLAIGLSTGSPEVDPRAAAAVAGAAERMRYAGAAAAVAQPTHDHGRATVGDPRSTPSPGWYSDPGGDQLRWWDGSEWTDDVRAKP